MRKATDDDHENVIDVTARTFDDDPVLDWMLRRDDRHSEAVRLFMQALGRLIYFRHNEVYVNEAGTGATMWLPPGASGDIGILEQIRSIPTMIRMAGLSGISRLWRVQSLLEKKHPTQPHYYLFTIAALPEKRGQGIGSSLMEPMTQRFDEQQVGAYLENSREANFPFYRRHGFEVMEHLHLPGGPPMWLMWREPISR